MKQKALFVLGIIFIFGVLLRFYQLGEVPVGFHRDEAFLGYNAYSLLKTARDMSGDFLPLHLRSFIYSPAGYSYIAMPFISLFDLNAYSVRFPAALFGSLTIIVSFFLAMELFRENKYKKIIGLLTAFLLAISPWHINLSRTATENVIVVFFISLGVLFYLIWTRRNKRLLLLLSFLFFGATFLLYQAPRAFLPMFIPLMIFSLAVGRIDKKKLIQPLILFFIIVLLPLFAILFSKDLSLRIKTVSIFATGESQLVLDEQIREDGVSDITTFASRFFHNKPTIYLSQFMQNYFAHFSFDFLFSDSGVPPRYTVPNMGIIYIIELPFLVIGALNLLDQRKKNRFFLLAWVLVSPIGSALTFDDVPNLQRTLIMFPALSIISANGFLVFFEMLKKQKWIVVGISALLVAAFFYSFAFYLHQYYIHQVAHKPWNRHEGYEMLVEKINNLLPYYNKAVITTTESAPAIFFLFYGKYDPTTFQRQTKDTKTNDFDRIEFDKYSFSSEGCPLIELEVRKNEVEERIMPPGIENNILYVNGLRCEVPEDDKVKLLDEIKRKDNSLIFHILEYRSKVKKEQEN